MNLKNQTPFQLLPVNIPILLEVISDVCIEYNMQSNLFLSIPHIS